ncbi:hypothetical protein D3C81_1441830 [compost metagenome]
MPAAKPDQVTKTRVSAYRHAKRLGPLDGATHGARVAGMKAGGDVGRTDEGHQFVVDAVADGPRAEALAHVRIEVYCLHAYAPGACDGVKVTLDSPQPPWEDL